MKSGRHRAAGGRATRRPDHSAPRHQQRRAGQRRPLIAALGLLIVLSAFVSWLPGDVGQPPPRQPGWTISDSDQRTVLLRDAVVPVPTDGFFSWAAMNRRTGLLTGSANLNAQSDTMSLVKAWLAADDLRRADERGRLPAPRSSPNCPPSSATATTPVPTRPTTGSADGNPWSGWCGSAG